MSDLGGGGGTSKPAAPTSQPADGQILTFNPNPGPYGFTVPGFTDAGSGGGLFNNPRPEFQPTPYDLGPNGILGGNSFQSSQPSALPKLPTFNLNSDPGVLNALALEQQGLSQNDANLKALRERAIISFGDPALAQEAGFGLDPQAGAFARQNYLSGNATLARLDKQHQLARKAVIDRLVAHGLLGSGDLGYGQGQADQGYGNQVYDAKQQLLDYLSNLFQTYLDRRNQYESQVQNARQQAIQNYLANPDTYSAAFGG